MNTKRIIAKLNLETFLIVASRPYVLQLQPGSLGIIAVC